MTTVEAQELGLQVRVTHLRFAEEQPGTMFAAGFIKAQGWTAHPKGGMTVARVYSPSGQLLSEGVAQASLLDNYSRKRGRDIAVGRALKDI